MLFPALSQEQAQIRSDSYSYSSARYFVTLGTLYEIKIYCVRKQQAGESVNVHNLCQLAMMHKSNKKNWPSYRRYSFTDIKFPLNV